MDFNLDLIEKETKYDEIVELAKNYIKNFVDNELLFSDLQKINFNDFIGQSQNIVANKLALMVHSKNIYFTNIDGTFHNWDINILDDNSISVSCDLNIGILDKNLQFVYNIKKD